MQQPTEQKQSKPKMWLYLAPLAIFIGLIALFFVGLGLNPNLIPSPLLDKPAPAFSLPELGDESEIVEHTDFNGQVSLFNIWATWCPSCKVEHPVLMKIAASKEVPIYGLYYKDEPEKGLAWLQEHGNPYIANAVDTEGKVGIEWGAYGTPETFIIDQQGIIRYKHVGPVSWQDWQETLLPLIQSLRQKRDIQG